MVGVGDKQKMQLDGGKGYKWLRSGCVRSQNEVGGVRTFRPKDALSFTQTQTRLRRWLSLLNTHCSLPPYHMYDAP